MVVADPRQILANIDDFTFLERVPIDLMFVAPYGRAVGRSQLGRMLKSGFDIKKLGIITLSMRSDGRYAVLDGNHRRHLCHDLGMTHMLARVFIDLTYEQEAELFEALNTMKTPTALERFNSRLEYREPMAMDIVRILEKYSLTISRTSGKPPRGKVACVGALDALYLERGPAEFTEVINIIHTAWGDDPNAWTGAIVSGFRQFWARYRDQVDFKRLIVQLQMRMPNQVLAAAGAYAGGTESIATRVGKYVVTLYNGKARSNKLSDWPQRVQNPTPMEGPVTVRAGKEVVRRVEQARGLQERKR